MTEQDVKIEIPMKVGFVYKLCSRDVSVKKIYVGITTNLRNRKYYHNVACNTIKNKNYNLPVYKYIRENGGFQNWDIIQLERVEYNTRSELNSRERYYIELLNAELNNKSIVDKFMCECGCICTNKTIEKHLKGKLHKENMIGINYCNENESGYLTKQNLIDLINNA